jgi:hypothetical protein
LDGEVVRVGFSEGNCDAGGAEADGCEGAECN